MGELESVERAIDALEGQRSSLGDAVVELALAPLVERRGRLLAGTADQRKQVTVLFSDLVDFTVLSQALDAEDVRSIMGEYFAAWARCIEAEAGVVEKYIGDAVMAVFGIHRAHEDDPHRAVRSALAMVDELSPLSRRIEERHGVAIQMRVGIDTGEVVVSALSDRPGEDPVVVGEIVNRAARLQAAAPPGGVLLSADTCMHVRGSFALQGVGALELKGIEKPVEAYLALGAGATGFWPETRGVEGVVTRTIGRHLELGWLQKAFDDVAGTGPDGDGTTGGLAVVSVIGHAGVGKSRLLREFETWLAARPDHIRVLRGRASPSTEAVPNGLLRNLYAERLAITAGDPADVVLAKWDEVAVELGTPDAPDRARAHLLAHWLGFQVAGSPHLEGLTGDPQGLRTRARAVLSDHFRGLSAATPMVVLVEDAHWADDATLDVLVGLDRWLRDRPVLVVVTGRPALLERRPHWGEGLDVHAVLRLEPLSRRDSLKLIGEIMQRAAAVPTAITDVLAATSEGNPFYMEELVKWLVGERVIDVSDDHWVVTQEALDVTRVPATLKGVLQARLDTLSPDERATVHRASVVGRVFWDGAVRRLDAAGVTDTDDALGRLRAREIVYRRERSTFPGTAEYSFRHALLRDVAYETVLRSTRAGYHGEVADWLAGVAADTGRAEEYAAAIAEHLAEAGRRTEAADWYLRAGIRAGGVYANAEALALLDEAWRLSPPGEPDVAFEALLATESVLDRIGDRTRQRAVLDRLAGLAGTDPVRRAAVALAEAGWAFAHGEYDSAVENAAQASRLAAGAGRGVLEARAQVVWGKSLAWRGSPEEARPVLVAARRRAEELGHLVIAVRSLRFQAVIANLAGAYTEGLDLLATALAILEDHPDSLEESLVYSQQGVILDEMGRFEEALGAYGRALEQVEASGYQFSRAMLVGNMAGVAVAQGRLGDARRQALEALRICEELGDVEGQAETHYWLGQVARLSGDHTGARTELATAAAQAAKVAADVIVVNAATATALVETTTGRQEEALAESRRALARAGASRLPASEARALLVVGLIHLDLGDAAAALPVLEQARARCSDLRLERRVAECDAAVALATHLDGRTAEAVERVGPLLDRLRPEDLEGCVEPGRVLLACSDVLTAAGDRRAPDVAGAIDRYLTERAAAIDDEALRTGFLERNPLTASLAARARARRLRVDLPA